MELSSETLEFGGKKRHRFRQAYATFGLYSYINKNGIIYTKHEEESHLNVS